MRIPFLLLTPICLFLGLAAAIKANANIALLDVTLLLLGGLAAHISVNALNEYSDFKSGLDQVTQKTPFSGGSGGLIDMPHAANRVLLTGIIALLVTIVIGLYFVASKGLTLLPIGIIGAALIVTYTNWVNKLPLLCLIAPGLAFGPLMVVGSYFVLTQSISHDVILLSLVPFFMINNLLLINQLPDVEADKTVGRHHLPIAYGKAKATKVYILFAALAALVVQCSVQFGVAPAASLLTLLPITLAVIIYQGAQRYADDIPQLIPYLGKNVAISLLSPAILACTLLLG